jgi:hypothetical protein
MTATNDNSKTRRRAVARWRTFAFLAAGFVICCLLAYHIGQLVSHWRHAKDADAIVRADATTLGSLSPTLPLAGMWSFDELNWNMRSEWTSEQDLATKFANVAAKEPALPDDELPDADQEFLTLASTLGVKSTERDGKRIYQLSRPGLKMQWITRDVNGTAKSCAFAVAYYSVDDRWQVFEFTPRRKDTAGAPNAAHLLPLPAGAHRDGGRHADNGRVEMEFVSLTSTADSLIEGWASAGWEVRKSGFGEPDEFSYLAVRGNETIYAWSSDPSDAMRNLMLVRTPEVANTGR